MFVCKERRVTFILAMCCGCNEDAEQFNARRARLRIVGDVDAEEAEGTSSIISIIHYAHVRTNIPIKTSVVHK